MHETVQASLGQEGHASCKNGIQVSEVRWRWMMAQMMDRAVREQRCASCAMLASWVKICASRRVFCRDDSQRI